MVDPIYGGHEGEGEFPLNLYSNNYTESYRNGYHLNNIGDCPACCRPDLHKPVHALKRPLYIIDIAATKEYTITLSISYSDGTVSTFKLEKNKKYTITYVKDGKMYTKTGVITSIGQVNSSSCCECNYCNSDDYIIRLDSSENYVSSVDDIRTSTIRQIKEYIPYSEEDTTILNARTSGVTVAGKVNDISITNATIDKDGNLTAGVVTAAVIDEEDAIIADGCAVGVNNLNHTITVMDSIITGGTIIKGNIISGIVKDFEITVGDRILTDVDDLEEPIENCTVTAEFATLVATECNVVGARSEGGIVIEPIIKDSVVTGGTRSGNNMVTLGAMVIDSIGYGGTITGGTLNGGTALGLINNKPFVIENGITTGGESIRSTVENGTIIEGQSKGTNAIIGAIIKNGTAKCDTTIHGVTTLGGVNSFIKPQYTTLPPEIKCRCKCIEPNYESNIGDVIIWWKFVNRLNCNDGYSNVYKTGQA